MDGKLRIMEILEKHIKLDWLNANDGRPDIIGIEEAATELLRITGAPTSPQAPDEIAKSVESERADAMNAGLNQKAFRKAWSVFQNTPIDLAADSDDETCKCLSNAIKAFLLVVHAQHNTKKL